MFARWLFGLGMLGAAACVLPEQELASETDICFACAQAPCGNELGACSADESCGALLTCVQACGGDDCINGCIASNADGVPLATPVLDCATASCPDDCASLGLP